MKDIIKKIRLHLDAMYHTQHIKEQLKYEMYNLYLKDKILYSEATGVSNKKYTKYEIIVSLTTYGKRLYTVATTIESIMQGTMKPNRIILWLDNDMQNVPLPIALQKQLKRGLEINYCRDIRSYKKLIPTMKKYPDASIITIDDDLIYQYDLVEKLVNMHIAHPDCIIANRIHQIVLNEDGTPKSYMDWKWNANPSDSSPLNFFTSGGGTLFPPNSFNEEVFKEDVFLNICKYADDIWFYAMALKKGTKVLKCYTHDKRGEDYLVNEDVQDMGLCNINTGKNCANDIQIKAVFNHYNLWNKLKENK